MAGQTRHANAREKVYGGERNLGGRVQADYSFSTETSVALIIAKTLSPSLRFMRFIEPVVIIDFTSRAASADTCLEALLSNSLGSQNAAFS